MSRRRSRDGGQAARRPRSRRPRRSVPAPARARRPGEQLSNRRCPPARMFDDAMSARTADRCPRPAPGDRRHGGGDSTRAGRDGQADLGPGAEAGRCRIASWPCGRVHPHGRGRPGLRTGRLVLPSTAAPLDQAEQRGRDRLVQTTSPASSDEEVFTGVGQRAEVSNARNPHVPLMVWMARNTRASSSGSEGWCSRSTGRGRADRVLLLILQNTWGSPRPRSRSARRPGADRRPFDRPRPCPRSPRRGRRPGRPGHPAPFDQVPFG